MRTKGLLNAMGGIIILSTFACKWEQLEPLEPLVDCSLNPVLLEIVESKDAGCGASNGSFTVNAVGGEGPYDYSSDLGNNSDGIFENVSAGSIKVVATDVRGCAAELSVTIFNLDGVNITDVVVSDSGCDTSNGVIHIEAEGGEDPYLYSINGGSTQTNNVFSSLAEGQYIVNVTDQLGCEISKSVEIQSGISYQSSIKSIIKNNCAVSGCHNGTQSPDFRSFSNIQSRANSIKSRTANGSMPKGSSLSQTQIDQIACWVEDGALDN